MKYYSGLKQSNICLRWLTILWERTGTYSSLKANLTKTMLDKLDYY